MNSPDTFHDSLRLTPTHMLDLLAVLAAAPASATRLALPAASRASKGKRRHTQRFLEGLALAEIDPHAERMRPLPRCRVLTQAWQDNDLDALFDVLRPWSPLRQVALGLERSEKAPRPLTDTTRRIAQGLAALVGQGMMQNRAWYPGGRAFDPASLRAPILQALEKARHTSMWQMPTLPVFTLLTEIVLAQLHVSPVRFIRAWDTLSHASVFEELEFRAGGSSSGKEVQTVAELHPNGWHRVAIDLETIHGFRDVTRQEKHGASPPLRREDMHPAIAHMLGLA